MPCTRSVSPARDAVDTGNELVTVGGSYIGIRDQQPGVPVRHTCTTGSRKRSGVRERSSRRCRTADSHRSWPSTTRCGSTTGSTKCWSYGSYRSLPASSRRVRSSSSSAAAADRCSSMRVTYACGELSGTSSSTSISFTTAARELAVLLGHDQHADGISRGSRPLDHHGYTGRLQPAPEDLRLEARPFAQLDERFVVGLARTAARPVHGWLAVDQLHPAVGADLAPGPILRAARRAPHRRTVPAHNAWVDSTLRSPPVAPHSSRGIEVYGNCDSRMASRATALLRRDARLPEERRRLRQGRRVPARRRARRRPSRPRMPTSSSSTPARSSKPPARSRSTSRSRSPTRSAPARSSSSRAAWPSATATSWPAALPEADAVVGLRGRGRDRRGRSCLRPQADRRARSARAAAARAERAVGLREDRRGLRPRVRVLCDPVVPRAATIAHARRDRSRSARARRSGVARARARRARPRVVRARRRRAGLARAVAAPARRARARTASRACACSTCIRPRCTTRSSRRCSSCRPSCRTSTSRCSTRRRRCCGA